MMNRILMAIACISISGMTGNDAKANDRDGDLYAVTGIVAQATADNGVLAKKIATEQAISAAYGKILERLTLKSQRSRLLDLDRSVIDGMISNYAILSEKAGPTSYRASLDVQFNRASVMSSLQAVGVGIVEVQAPVLLVMPVRVENGAIDWDETEWREIWKKAADPTGIVPYRVFNGDEADRSYLTSGNGSGSALELATLAMRYDAEFSVMVTLTETEDGSMTMRLAGRDGVGQIDVSQTFGGLRGVERPTLRLLAQGAIGEFEARWKSAILGTGNAGSAFAPPREQLSAKAVLEAGLVADSHGNVPSLADLIAKVGDVAELAPKDGEGTDRIEIVYSGTVTDLQTEFAQRQFALVRAGDAWWLTPY